MKWFESFVRSRCRRRSPRSSSMDHIGLQQIRNSDTFEMLEHIKSYFEHFPIRLLITKIFCCFLLRDVISASYKMFRILSKRSRSGPMTWRLIHWCEMVETDTVDLFSSSWAQQKRKIFKVNLNLVMTEWFWRFAGIYQLSEIFFQIWPE